MNKILVASFLAFLLVSLLPAQWIQTNGPYSANFKSFTSNNERIFALAYWNHVYISENDGLSWKEISNGLENLAVNEIIAIDNNIFAATSSGLFQYSPAEMKWLRSNNIPGNARINSISVINGNVYAAGDTIYHSTDRGLSWDVLNTNLPITTIENIAAFQGKNGINLYACIDEKFYRSTNEGITWQVLDEIWGSKIIAFDSLVFIPAGGYLFTSFDYGESWTKTDVVYNQNINCLTSINSNILLGTSEGNILKSSDNGGTWNEIVSGTMDFPVNKIYSSGSGIFYGTNTDIFRSTDEGENWVMTTKGINNTSILSLGFITDKNHNLRLFAGSLGFNYSSVNAGESWEKMILPETGSILEPIKAFIAIDTLIIINITGKIFKSTDYGGTWISTDAKSIACRQFEADKDSSNYIFAAASGGMYLSTDYGSTWASINRGFNSSPNCLLSVSSNKSIPRLIVGTFSGIIVSNDRGKTWKKISSLLDNISINCFMESNGSVFAGTDQGIYTSSDYGESWNKTNSNLPEVIINVIAGRGNNMFIGTSNGLYFSTDNGQTWAGLNEGIPDIRIENLLLAKDSNEEWYIFYGSLTSGVWKYPLSGILTDVADKKEPGFMDFVLIQNYPNPFNPVTSIQYQIPKASFVILKVHDILGREVATLVNEEKSAGTYRVEFSGNNLSSGIYFYSIQAGEFKQVKKMILAK